MYFTAGYPNLNDTGDIIFALQNAGVDMAEVGAPFSDPMADGPTIQNSSARALKNGMNLRLLLDQVAEARAKGATIPLVLMGYLNQMMSFGAEKLFAEAARVGIDAMIIPDLPVEEFDDTLRELSLRYDIPVVMLVTPETPDRRIRMIDQKCQGGFIYVVSDAAITGTREKYSDASIAYFKRLADMGLTHRRLIGFGVSNPATFDAACANSSGAIIGSLFIKCLAAEPDIDAAVSRLLNTLKG